MKQTFPGDRRPGVCLNDLLGADDLQLKTEGPQIEQMMTKQTASSTQYSGMR